MRLWMVIALLGVASGCLSADKREPSGDGETGTPTADTGAEPDDSGRLDSGDSGEETDTGETGGVEPSAPVMTSFSTTQDDDEIVVSFTAEDADGDLDGGMLDLEIDGDARTFAIGDELASWDGQTGEVRLGFNDCRRGGSVDVVGSVSDASGLSSEQGQDTVTLEGTVVLMAEGDEPDYGSISEATWYCGSISETDPTEHATSPWYGTANGDYDRLYALSGTLPRSGEWAFELSWDDETADYDLHLLVLYVPASGSYSYTHATWSTARVGTSETMSYTLDVTDDNVSNYYLYQVYVSGWDGPAGDYVLEVTPPSL